MNLIPGATRFEVIDRRADGRVLTAYDVRIEMDMQDEGRTMKVFLTDRSAEREEVDATDWSEVDLQPADDVTVVRKCQAKLWGGMPQYNGPHPAHFFAYGEEDQYTGYCTGRE